MGSRFWPCFLVFLSACVPPMPGYTGHDNPGHDFDGDGWTEADGDCDDQVGTTHPEADETCNGIDDDCNDLVDDGAVDEFEWTLDEDNDGYGKDSTAQMACTAPTPSYVTQGGDCDDNRADVHPGATEWCDGGTDEDCDGLVDLDDDDMAGNATWYQDLDGDGHGNLEVTLAACTQPPGYSALDDDCDDENSRRHPGHEELCDGIDNNCDGDVDDDDDDTTVADPAPWYADNDSDGFGNPTDIEYACEAPEGHTDDANDCDDTNATIHPGAAEACDGIDQDCDGVADEGVTTDYYRDADGDGYGDASFLVSMCAQPNGYVLDTTDCDDYEALVNPGADEVCSDGVDNNCDSFVDEDTAIDAGTYYLDADGDGFGDASVSVTRCVQPLSYVTDATDCQDLKAGVYPGATETCTTTYDDDCDGDDNDVDALGCTAWYTDGDGDGYGDTADTACHCSATAAHSSADATDCDDVLAAVNPAALEDCTTGVDDDCTGTDNDENASGCAGFYYDFDGDGYGLDGDAKCLCAALGYYSASGGGECDDADPAVHPAAAEVCGDAVDNDCSGDADGPDATDAATWYRDADGDGFGSMTLSQIACTQPSGYLADNTDCQDAMDAVYPGQTETCLTAHDDDCDGNANNTGAVNCQDYYRDDDGDGYGLAGDTLCRCSEEGAYTSRVPTDCNDADAGVSPAETETCDTSDDEDCNGTADENGAENCVVYFYDWDGDTYGTDDSQCSCLTDGYYTALTLGDCNDTDATINPSLLNCGLMGDVTRSEAAAVTSGGSHGANVGTTDRSFVGGFDYNGDGYDDVLFGSTGYDTAYTDIGAAFLFLGPVTGSLDLSGPGSADLFFSKSTGAGVYGGSHVFAGDFDGDGAVELMVSGYGADNLWVIDDGLTGLGALDETSFGVTEYAYATGESIGDVDFDGFDDAFLCPSNPNLSCTVAYGSTTGLAASGYTWYVDGYAFTGNYNGAQGSATTSGGDLNGDGVSDFARVASCDFYVHLGAQGVGISSTPDASIIGGDSFQSMLEILTDVTGDGYGDLAVTYSSRTVYDPLQGNITTAGILAILPGGATLPATTAIDATGTAIVGDSGGDRVGIDADAADVDGDGVGDLLVTAHDYREAPRLFYGPIVPGAHSISTSDARFLTGSNDYSGVARAGDTNADGYEDFLVGRIDDYSNGNVHLFTGTSN